MISFSYDELFVFFTLPRRYKLFVSWSTTAANIWYMTAHKEAEESSIFPRTDSNFPTETREIPLFVKTENCMVNLSNKIAPLPANKKQMNEWKLYYVEWLKILSCRFSFTNCVSILSRKRKKKNFRVKWMKTTWKHWKKRKPFEYQAWEILTIDTTNEIMNHFHCN